MNNIIIDIHSSIDQLDNDIQEIEMTTEGEWYEKNGASFIVYQESEISGMKGSKTILKIQGETITMTRFGAAASKMVFDTAQAMHSQYKTPYGNFDMAVQTRQLTEEMDFESLTGRVHIEYQMTLENVSNSINILDITIRKAS